MGKILIASDSAGCRDTVDDQVSGFLCKAKDVDSLVDCMEKIINMTDGERRKMGMAGREKMKKEFDINYIIKHYQAALEQHLNSR